MCDDNVRHAEFALFVGLRILNKCALNKTIENTKTKNKRKTFAL